MNLKERLVSGAVKNYIEDFIQMEKDEFSNFTFCGAVTGSFFQGNQKVTDYYLPPKMYKRSLYLFEFKDICASHGCKPRNLDRRMHVNCCDKHIFPTRLIRNLEERDLKTHSKIYYSLNAEFLWKIYLKINHPKEEGLSALMNRFTEIYSKVSVDNLVSKVRKKN